MGTLSVHLFGAPDVVRDGASVAVETRKAIALLAVLVVENRPVRRDVLAAMLWPDADQERARGSLRRTLSALRSAIGPDAVAADRETIALEIEPDVVDTMRFELLSGRSPGEAVALYKGDFLEGFSVADAPEFEDWQRREADRFRLRVDELLDALADDADASEKPGLLRRRLELDPLNEAASRRLMAALSADGDRRGAIEAYRTLVTRLDRDLGVEPLSETTELYEAIRRGEHAPRRVVAGHAPHHRSAEPALVGRTHDLRKLSQAVQTHRLVLVTGEPGIGRTRLLSEWATTSSGCLQLRAHVGEHHIPFAPLSPWLGSIATAARVRLFEELAAALPVAPGAALVFDDLQLSDAATNSFLTYVLHRHDRFGWSLVAGWQGERLTPADAYWDLLTEGRRDGWATEFSVGRLGRADSKTLATAAGATTESHAEAIAELAEGLPLLIVESARVDPGLDGLAPAVEDLMRARLAGIGPIARQVVEALAVIDRPADEWLVQEVSGRSEPETAVALDELQAGSIVRIDDQVALTHRLLGAVALSGLSNARVRVLHERAGRALAPAEAADHLARAGLRNEAALAHLRAADEAEATHAPSSALRHLRAAQALGVGDDPLLHLRIGDLETILGGYGRARRAYEISAATSTGPDLAAVELQLARLALRRGDPTLARSHLDSASAELDALRQERPTPLSLDLLVCRALATADHDDAASLTSSAIDMAQSMDDPAAEAGAEGAAALVAHRRGDRATTSQHAHRAIRLAQLGAAPLVEAAAANMLGLTGLATDDRDRAVAWFERAREILAEHGDVHRLAAVHANLGDALHAAGRDVEAREHQLESARLFSEVSGPPAGGGAELWLLTAW